jgi:predicted DNA-binding protein (UPF0251 family)
MPGARYFKPRGIPMNMLEDVVLNIDELEAVRLADYEGLYQEQAAEKMRISRPTFGRIVESAHRKIADVLVNGKALRIEGGNIEMREFKDVAHGMGAGGFCVCPKCNEKVPHKAGMPCKDEKCPKCGSRMMREGSSCHEKLLDKKDK